MRVGQIELEKKYHDAVEHWRRHWMPDYDSLLSNWERYFPKDEPFCLCAKLELGTPELVQVGDHKGEQKRLKPDELTEEEAKHLLAIIRAQASTEFGSIQPLGSSIPNSPARRSPSRKPTTRPSTSATWEASGSRRK